MYTKSNNHKYNNETADYAPITYLNNIQYSNSVQSHYKSLISESKCRCKGTCRTGIGCTCRNE